LSSLDRSQIRHLQIFLGWETLGAGKYRCATRGLCTASVIEEAAVKESSRQ
jgi:hypothetical protein